MMELRRLRLLHELARRGTVAAVAEALDYSPSSVSVQLSELEREAGTQLLRKVGRTLQLTPAGHRLADHAARALTAGRGRPRRARDAERRAARPAAADASCRRRRSRCSRSTLADARDDRADLRVEVVHSETAPALADLRSRAVDFVVGHRVRRRSRSPATATSTARTCCARRCQLVVPVDHELASSGEARSRSPRVEHAAWAAGQPGTGHAAAVNHLCNRLGNFAPDVRHRTDDGLLLRALVASGQAVTILPALIATATPQVAARPIAEGDVHRTIFTAVRAAATQAPAVLAVREALRAAAAKTELSPAPSPPGRRRAGRRSIQDRAVDHE